VALAFFIVLLCAALTSALSLLEVITAYFVDEFALSRVRAAFLSKRISSLTYYL
jgi:NSS family neurotransmitter:Na+ symporter